MLNFQPCRVYKQPVRLGGYVLLYIDDDQFRLQNALAEPAPGGGGFLLWRHFMVLQMDERLNHVCMESELLPVLKHNFEPLFMGVSQACGRLKQYFYFIGGRQAKPQTVGNAALKDLALRKDLRKQRPRLA